MKNLTALTVLVFIFLSFSIKTTAQEYFLNSETNGTTITTCSGTMYDSGGAEGYYGNSEDYIVSICSSNPENLVSIEFTQFNTEYSYDFLKIYDGNSVSSDLIIQGSGTTLSGQTISASGSCLTLNFVSDGSVGYYGFELEISCSPGCQDYNINILSTEPFFESPLSYQNNLCPGSSVIFNAQGIYPNNNLNYLQTDENVSWKWIVSKLNDETVYYEELGLTQYEHTFTQGGIYNVSLQASDSNGCISICDERYRFTISLAPNLSDIYVEPGICAGESIELTNAVTYDSIVYEIIPTSFDTICMSDEFYLQWQSMCMFVSANTPGQIINSEEDLESVCIKMEHSYIGDLDILVECPNGQTAELLSYNDELGSLYFGEPIDVDSLPCQPGIGYDYCFSMSAQDTIASFEGFNETIPAGTYIPTSSYSDLIGCPVEGTWCIKIMDHLFSDDGIIFSFGLNFADGINLNDTTIVLISTVDLSPDSEDIFWSGPDVEPNHGLTTVSPEVPGNYDYTLSITDNLGCTTESTYNVTVYDINDPFCDTYCSSMLCSELTDTITDGSDEYPSQNDSYCFWMITPASKSVSDIFFYWNYFNVYNGDTLKIYQINDDVLTLFYEFTGNSTIPESFVIPGNEAYITYTTDGTMRSPGWELVYQTVPTGLTGNKIGDISVFPNPVSDLVSISGMDSPANVSVVDMCGRVVISASDFENSNIDMSSLENGIYFIKISGETNYSFKILKH